MTPCPLPVYLYLLSHGHQAEDTLGNGHTRQVCQGFGVEIDLETVLVDELLPASFTKIAVGLVI